MGPFLIISILKNDLLLPQAFFAVCFLLLIFFVIKDKLAAYPLISVYFSGAIHLLPLNLTLMDVFSVALIIYYGIAYLALRQKPIHLGPFPISFPIFVLGLIVLYHNHSFGLKALNSSDEGSRPGIAIMIMVMAYFCGISLATLPVTYLKKIPWYCCFIALFSTVPFLISTYFPSLTPYIYIFSTNVNVDAYVNDLSITATDTGNIGRMGAYAAVGAAVQALLISQYPIYTWWRPERWGIALLSLISFWLTVSAGYRNAVFGFLITTVAGAWCYYSWRAILVPAFLAFAAYLLIGVQMSHMGKSFLPELPMTVQRSLSFLPGDWSQEVKESASSSNDFRNNIQRVYIKEYLNKSPLIGNGFTFDASEAEQVSYIAAHSDTPDLYYQAKGFIISKAFHVGWISLYDCVGIIGSLAFTALGFNMIVILAKSISKERYSHTSVIFGLKVWLFCMLCNSMFGFFLVYGDFKLAFPCLCAYAIILCQIMRISRKSAIAEDLSTYSN